MPETTLINGPQEAYVLDWVGVGMLLLLLGLVGLWLFIRDDFTKKNGG